MFQAVGGNVDPQRKVRLLIAFLVAMVAWGALWVMRVAVRLLWVLLQALLSTFWEPVEPPAPELTVEPVEMRMVELVVLDPELTPDMLPPPPPEHSPPPPVDVPPADVAAPASAPVAEELPPVAAVDVVELMQTAESEVREATEADPAVGGAREVLEPPNSLQAGFGAADVLDLSLSTDFSDEIAGGDEADRAAFRDSVARARQRGLLTLRAADATFEMPEPERDPWDTDPPEEEAEPPKWDGLFGARDVHLLISALEAEELARLQAGAVTGSGSLGTSDRSGYRLSASHMGGGAFGGGMMVLRIPPTRDVLSVEEPKLPRALRRSLEEPQECVFFVDVDGFGLATDLQVVSCDEALEPHAREAVHATRWKLADDLEEKARVRHTVTFRP